MSPLKTRIVEDTKAALKAGDKTRLSVLRMLSAAVRQREIDGRCELDDVALLAVVDKQIKQRHDAAAQYRSGGRPELAAAEEAEIVVLSAFLPQPLQPAALEALIERVIAEVGADSPRDIGKVMAALKPQVAGRADLAQVSARIRARLT
ncbi:MAG: GatB/YqeY domain-containing protein [Gammaproteobacteria bacterium]|nr:GatB/YqeY domain-containing protein [Gammaproteobacteria bacterium]